MPKKILKFFKERRRRGWAASTEGSPAYRKKLPNYLKQGIITLKRKPKISKNAKYKHLTKDKERLIAFLKIRRMDRISIIIDGKKIYLETTSFEGRAPLSGKLTEKAIYLKIENKEIKDWLLANSY